MSSSGSVLFKVGGVGYLFGFISWITWAILVILGFISSLTFHGFQFMSGIFFQAYFWLIFYSLLSISLLLSAIGCFAFARKQKSALGLASGVVFLIAFASLAAYLLAFATDIMPQNISYVRYLVFPFPLLFFVGLIIWGVTLLLDAGKTGVTVRSRTAGPLFLVSAIFGILVWPAISYWGLEIWLLMLGWLYAVGALLSALIFFRISRTIEKPAT